MKKEISNRFRLDGDGNLQRVGSRNKGKLGTIKRDGFMRIIYNGKAYQASHIVYYLKNGNWPVGVLKYIDGDRANINAGNLVDVQNEAAAATANSVKVVDSNGVVYDSITLAAKAVGRSQKSLRNAIRFNSSCAGRKWLRAKE